MKVLISLVSCVPFARGGHNQAVRDTWVKAAQNVPNWDYHFLIGNGYPTGEDETQLNMVWSARDRNYTSMPAPPSGYVPESDEFIITAPDDYLHIPFKVRRGFRWGVDNGFDFIFGASADNYIDVKRLLAAGLEKFDYFGYGAGMFWVSAKAADYLSRQPIDDWATDRWVIHKLMQAGICEVDEFGLPVNRDRSRFVDYPLQPLKTNDIVATHLFIADPTKKYDPRLMRHVHNMRNR